MESPTTSPWVHNYSDSSASEQASDSESTDDSSEWSETSAPRTSNRMTGTYTGGTFKNTGWGEGIFHYFC